MEEAARTIDHHQTIPASQIMKQSCAASFFAVPPRALLIWPAILRDLPLLLPLCRRPSATRPQEH